MNKTTPLRLDMTWFYGLLLLGLSLFFFCIPTVFHLAEVPEGLFFANYLIAVFYLVVVVASNRIKVRNDQDVCSPQFKPDLPVIVFAVADPNGVLWTRACFGNATLGDARYETLKQDLTNRLRYD